MSMFCETLSSSSEDMLTVDDIIEERPKTKIVREFFRENLAGILSEEEVLFSQKLFTG